MPKFAMKYHVTPALCGDCIKPVTRRLGLFNAKDEYECYAESYVKGFWGMCDIHKSMESLTTAKLQTSVITTQPVRLAK